MPDRVNVAVVSCPQQTPITAPVEVVFSQFPPGIPRRLTVTIPSGHSGLTGIAFGYGHQPILPDNSGAFISGDDDVFHFDLHNYPAGPQWSAFVCNLDLQAHVWQVMIEFDEIGTDTPAPTAAEISPDAITAAGDQTLADNTNVPITQ